MMRPRRGGGGAGTGSHLQILELREVADLRRQMVEIVVREYEGGQVAEQAELRRDGGERAVGELDPELEQADAPPDRRVKRA